MKLILRADVENLGILGDVVEVKAGYGRNFLLPQGLAMVASPSNLKAFEQERKKLQARMDAVRSEALALQASLEALDVVIPMHVATTTSFTALSPPPSLATLLPPLAWTLTAAAFLWMPPSAPLANTPFACACTPA